MTAAQTPDGVDHDPRTTLTGYDPLVAGDTSGWTLRAATTTTTDMPGATPDIVKKTRYDAAGNVIETRMPSDTGGTGAGTSRTTYYTATGTGTCGAMPYWAGLTCQAFPAAQPGTGPNLPTTTTTYTLWDAPDTVTEVAGTTTRTTTTSYDGAGRAAGQTIAVTPVADGGAPVPAVTTGYDPATGLATTTSSSAGTITVGYDSVGQATSYTQAAGGTTVTTATKTYDIAGRVATSTDGKGTTTYAYDSATDHRGNAVSVTDSLAGAMLATYDADGGAEVVTYPGGLTATTADDNAGNDIRLMYAKAGTTWMTFTQAESVHGQVRVSAGTASRQLNGYDPAARLTRVDDLAGPSCTRRDYAFDANTNRAGLTTTIGVEATPSPTALCDLTGKTPATTTSTYDAADRAAGYTYDNLGRSTAVPATAVAGSAALAVGYSANDMVNTLTQGGRTRTYTLDPAGRILTTADTAGPTLTDHYTGGDDNPAWIGSSDSTWTRYLPGASGGLGLSVTNTGTVTLQLANLHGDIVATCASTDTMLPNYTETTEFGLPRDISAPTARYGWLGSHRRDTGDALAQLTLMGARLYNPTTGRFLSVDPEPGGSANDYDYCNADPINCTDLDGRWPRWARRAGNWASHHKVDIALTALSFAPGVGSAVWAYRAYRVVRIARVAYKAGKINQGIRASRATSWLAGRMWVGRGAYSTSAKNGARWLRSSRHKFSWRSATKKGKYGYSSNLNYSVKGHHDYWNFHINHRRFF